MRKQIYIYIVALVVLSACGKGDGTDPSPDPGSAPTAATLTLPVNNEVCTTGKIVSATESTITFAWKASANTESYDLTIKNLETGVSVTQTTAAVTLDATLKRNTPYSWFVTAKSAKSASTSKSDTWKFYNSGPGVTSYAPFPAEILTPAMGQSVTPAAGKITLDWSGSDADNDIAAYDIYFGTAATPPLLKAGEKGSVMTDIAVTPLTTYYWKIITKDSKGNASDSGVYQFKVN